MLVGNKIGLRTAAIMNMLRSFMLCMFFACSDEECFQQHDVKAAIMKCVVCLFCVVHVPYR